MKNKLPALTLKRYFLKVQEICFSVEDGRLRQLLRLSLMALVFVSSSGLIYCGLDMALVPYYQTQQLSEQRISFENHLQKLPLTYADQWRQFEGLQPSFLFTTIKIKTAIYSLCQQYGVDLKGGQIQDTQTEKGLSFKVGDLTITARTDTQIFALLQHLAEKLSGVLGLKVIKVHRSRDLNEALLAQIKAGKKSELVEAKIEFEWLIFKE